MGPNLFQMKRTEVEDLEVTLKNTTPATPTSAATQAHGNTPDISTMRNPPKKQKRTTLCDRDPRPGGMVGKNLKFGHTSQSLLIKEAI